MSKSERSEMQRAEKCISYVYKCQYLFLDSAAVQLRSREIFVRGVDWRLIAKACKKSRRHMSYAKAWFGGK